MPVGAMRSAKGGSLRDGESDAEHCDRSEEEQDEPTPGTHVDLRARSCIT
jgi:hypothetical protein